MDILQVIKADNINILGLIRHLFCYDSCLKIPVFFGQFETEVILQFNLKKTYIYPELLSFCNSSDRFVDESIKRQEQILEYIKNIKSKIRNGGWELNEYNKSISELESLIKSHFNAEESVMFPKFRRNMPTYEREELNELIMDFKREWLSHKHESKELGGYYF
ncbi:MAG: hypothetical protein HQK54_04615 [Oligoflexales bacterium]|nr:hypothetical protein [Oligoflexales bacterium]